MASFAEREARRTRRQWVEEQFAAGKATRVIAREGSEHWGVTRKTIRHDLAAVRKRLAAAFSEETPDSVRARSEAILLDALAVAKASGDVSGMALVAQRLAEIHGAYKRELSVDVKVRGIADLLAMALDDDDSGSAPNARDSKSAARKGGAKAVE